MSKKSKANAGKGGGKRRVWFEVVCYTHGSKFEKNQSAPILKVSGYGKGCPQCR